MSERRHPNVVNVDEAKAMETSKGSFASKRKRLGAEAGGNALGCSHIEIAPGKTAFPCHAHTATEEALYVLSGTGTLRLGADSIELRAGDFVALLPKRDQAHMLTNTGGEALVYLALSSPSVPITIDIVTYPDSKKIAFAGGVDPKKGLMSAAVFGLIKEEQPKVDYYDDEPLAKE